MKAQTKSSGNRRTSGFTLLELLVVIAIIIILAGLLIAALPGAKKRVYDASTNTLLTGLALDCETYFADFDAYPGPMSPTVTTAGSGSKISGTQNLLLGLTYPVYASPAYTPGSPPARIATNAPPVPSYGNSGWVQLPGGLGSVHPTDASGPMNYAASPVRSLKPYYSPKSQESALISTTGGWNTFPTIVDRYPDPMPILYYRASGVSGAAAANLNPNGTLASIGANTVVVGGTSSGNSASYYYDENKEYTTASPLKSGGVPFDQNANTGTVGPDASNSTFLCGLSATSLTPYVANPSLPGAGNATLNLSSKGSFILISAGYDHLYGLNKKNVLNDDIVVSGGH